MLIPNIHSLSYEHPMSNTDVRNERTETSGGQIFTMTYGVLVLKLETTRIRTIIVNCLFNSLHTRSIVR
jgi:hypothetical protein